MWNIKNWKTRKKKGNNFIKIVPILAGKYCVPIEYNSSYANNIIHRWNNVRSLTSTLPPLGWPLSIVISVVMLGVLLINLRSIYLQNKKIAKPTTMNNKRAFQKSKNNNYNTEILDADSDMIIVDNSANCIVWKNKESFVKGTYRKISK